MPKQLRLYFHPEDLRKSLAEKVDDGKVIAIYKIIYNLLEKLLNMASSSNFLNRCIYWIFIFPVSILSFVIDAVMLSFHPLTESEIYFFLNNWAKDCVNNDNELRKDLLHWMSVHFLRPKLLPYEYCLLFGSDYMSGKISEEVCDLSQMPKSFVALIMSILEMLEKDFKSFEENTEDSKQINNDLYKKILLNFQDICNVSSILTTICLLNKRYDLLSDMHEKIFQPIRLMAKKIINTECFDDNVVNKFFECAILPFALASKHSDECIVDWSVMCKLEDNNLALRRVGCSRDDLLFVGLLSDADSKFTTKDKHLKDRSFYSFPSDFTDSLNFMLSALVREVKKDGCYVYGLSAFDVGSVDNVKFREKGMLPDWENSKSMTNNLDENMFNAANTKDNNIANSTEKNNDDVVSLNKDTTKDKSNNQLHDKSIPTVLSSNNHGINKKDIEAPSLIG